MPTPCVHFKLLKERVDQLSQKFLADQVAGEAADPLNFHPDLDKLAAFRLLVHAEIEDFLESKATERLTYLSSRMNAGLWMREAPELIALAIAVKRPFPGVDSLEQNRFVTYVQEVMGNARSAIKENNGVKSPSFLLLSLCAGKTVDEIDSVLSGSLNSYGKDRGDVAHKSVTHSTSLRLRVLNWQQRLD